MNQFTFNLQGAHLILCFLPRSFESLPPPDRQHSATIGCTKNYQTKEVTVHSQCVEIFEGLFLLCRRGRGCSELWKWVVKKTIFSWTPCICLSIYVSMNKFAFHLCPSVRLSRIWDILETLSTLSLYLSEWVCVYDWAVKPGHETWFNSLVSRHI